MSYSGNYTFVWQNTWFKAETLRGGLFAMNFKG